LIVVLSHERRALNQGDLAGGFLLATVLVADGNHGPKTVVESDSCIDVRSRSGYGSLEVASKKKLIQTQAEPPQVVSRAIRLKPSATDYATFVATTSKVLGATGPAARKTKPNARFLSLANMES
jgi:hypothetical protein